MPGFTYRTAVDIKRGLKAFLDLDVGLSRGEPPEHGQEAWESRQHVDARDLKQVRDRLEEKDRRLKQARKRLFRKERQVAGLRARLNDASARVGKAGARGVDSKEEADHLIERFHRLYYESGFAGGTWQNTFWLGVPTQKCPLDLWIYQEMLFELRPDLILECGTASGGSALFLASMCDILGKGEIITIDIEDNQSRPQHERVRYLLGSSTSEEVFEQVRPRFSDDKTVLVILDSDHSKDHVTGELQLYGPFVTRDSYVIVEDTNVNGHPVLPRHGSGPMEAVEEFLKANEDFVVDKSKEKFYLTFNPKGFLKKVR